MNDAEYERQKARVDALAKQWLSALGLDYWDITLEFYRGRLPSEGEDDGADPLARCKVKWQYLYATISWDLEAVAEESDGELERIFVHECMHVFLHELRHSTDDWLDHEERVAQMLAKAFVWVRNQERESAPPPKKRR